MRPGYRASAAMDEDFPRGFGSGPPAWLRLWGPVVVSLLVQVPGTFAMWVGNQNGHLERMTPSALQLAVVLLGPLALIGARRFPGPVVAIVVAGAVGDILIGPPIGPPYIALVFAIVGAVARGARGWAWASVGVGWVVALALGLWLGVDWRHAQVVATTFGVLLLLGAGEFMRTRRDRVREFSRIAAERRRDEIEAERLRIARELHDVLAHSLSSIHVQASVGLHLVDKRPEQAREALASIKDASRDALDEVRSVLGTLRSGDAPLVPEPDLARVEELVEAVSGRGLQVTLEQSVSDAPPAVGLALYRIVQESLTNAVRHSGAGSVTVRIERIDGDYAVEVRDDGHGGPVVEEGRGLIGMRERAELLGGSLEAGPVEGGFAVRARIPGRTEDA